jgi:hypothetical protein
LWATKETNNKNLCCLRIKKYLRDAQKFLFLFRAALRNNKNILTNFPCSGMTPKVQTAQGEQFLLKLGI